MERPNLRNSAKEKCTRTCEMIMTAREQSQPMKNCQGGKNEKTKKDKLKKVLPSN